MYKWNQDKFSLTLTEVETMAEGRRRYQYTLRDNGRIIFQGADYTAPRHHSREELIACLLVFLSTGEMDTDASCFDDYTPDQIAWRDSQRRENLAAIAYDMEEEIR